MSAKRSCFTRPFVAGLSGEALAGTLREMLHTLGTTDKQEELAASLDTSRVDFWRVFEKDKGFKKKLTRLQDCAGSLQYEVHALWTKPERDIAYALLVDTVYALGQVSAKVRQFEMRAGLDDAFARQRRVVEVAVSEFCALLNPSCTTVYSWNRRLNRTCILHHSGLRYPEAMYGISWRHDLPRMVLFEENDWIDRRYPREVAPPKTPPGFRTRERVKVCWAIQLRWDRSRMVVFLNWRDAAPVYKGETLTAKDVELAVRYLNGWLSCAAIDLSWDLDPISCPPSDILEDVGRALDAQTSREIGDELEKAALHALGVDPQRHCSIHWVESARGREPRSVLQFKYDCYDCCPAEAQPEFSLEPGPDGLVKKSVSAQAAVWEAPILIEDLDTKVPHDSPARAWRDISVGRPDWYTRSEIALPIKWAGRVRAVINVEHSRELLTKEHVRRVELVSHLFSRLHELRNGKVELVKGDCSFVRGLTERGRLPKDGVDLLKRFGEWVRQRVAADLVYVLVYDHTARIFRPRGVSASDDFISLYLQGEYEHKGRKQSPSMRLICEDSMAHKLFPKRRGRAWKVFTSLRPEAVPEVRTADPPPSPFTLKYFWEGSLLGLPFLCEANAQPDGVLWIRWRKQPNGLGEDDRYLDSTVPELLEPVLEVVAAVYAVYRYCDRDEEKLEPRWDHTRGELDLRGSES